MTSTLVQVSTQKKEFYFFVAILFVLSIFTVLMYFPEHRLYPGYDAYFHYNRIQALVDAMQDGSFPTYIEASAANGYGYGTKLFYSDFLLIPIALVAMVTNIIFAYKVFIFTTLFLCGYFTYLAANKISGSTHIAYLAGILVTFGYFRLIGLFLRSAFGEAYSYIFIPIIILGIYEIICGNYKKWYIFSLGFSLLIMSHLLTSLLTALFILPFVIFNYKKILEDKKRIYALMKATVVVIVLAVYGLLPLFEQLSSNVFFLEYHKELVHPALSKLGLIDILKGLVAGFKINDKNELIFLWDQGAGLILTLLVLLRIFIRKNTKQIKIADFCTVIGILLIFATSNLCPWGRFPLTLLKQIQFPWRLFEYVTFVFAYAGATYFVSLVDKSKNRLFFYGLIILSTIVMISIDSYNFRNSKYLKGASSTPTVSNLYNLGSLEYTPAKYVRYSYNFWDRISQREERVVACNENTVISNYSHVKSNIQFSVNTQNMIDTIKIPLFFYKGYSATFNNVAIEIEQSEDGLLSTVVNGDGLINIDFKGTFIQNYSFYVTIFGYVLFLFFIFYQNRRSKR